MWNLSSYLSEPVLINLCFMAITAAWAWPGTSISGITSMWCLTAYIRISLHHRQRWYKDKLKNWVWQTEWERQKPSAVFKVWWDRVKNEHFSIEERERKRWCLKYITQALAKAFFFLLNYTRVNIVLSSCFPFQVYPTKFMSDHKQVKVH